MQRSVKNYVFTSAMIQIQTCFKPTNFVAYSGSKIKTVCMVRLTMCGVVHTLSCYIVQENVIPPLGLHACKQMGLVSFNKAVGKFSPTDDNLSEEIQKLYSDLFSGDLGKLTVTWSSCLS